MSYQPRTLTRCFSVRDLEEAARRRLPSPIYNYLAGGAEDELTLRRNTTAFDDTRLTTNSLVDVSSISTSTTVLGTEIAYPVLCSPAGSQRFYHEDGELAAARAAEKAGTIYTLATMSSYSLEEVAAASTGPKAFQFFIFKDREITRELIRRCRCAGYKALCLTVDVAVRGKRERELRSGMGVPMNFSSTSVASFALRPRWLLGLLKKGPYSMRSFTDLVSSKNIVDQTRFFGAQLDPAVSWKDVREFVELWDGPFVIKGILSADDARRARDVGASAVMISNHGGRQLDSASSPYDVLPEIANAIQGEIEIILDGGIRRGVHVFKALARGATACSMGRPYLFGLATDGQRGALRAHEIIRDEFVTVMQLAGCKSIPEIDGKMLRSIASGWMQ